MARAGASAAGELFRKRLLAAMEAREISRAELATEMGVVRQSVSNWVAGKNEPNLSQLRKLAKALGVSASYLVGESEEEDPAKDVVALSDLASRIGALRLGPAIRSVNASYPDLLDLLGEAERLVDERQAKRPGR